MFRNTSKKDKLPPLQKSKHDIDKAKSRHSFRRESTVQKIHSTTQTTDDNLSIKSFDDPVKDEQIQAMLDHAENITPSEYSESINSEYFVDSRYLDAIIDTQVDTEPQITAPHSVLKFKPTEEVHKPKFIKKDSILERHKEISLKSTKAIVEKLEKSPEDNYTPLQMETLDLELYSVTPNTFSYDSLPIFERQLTEVSRNYLSGLILKYFDNYMRFTPRLMRISTEMFVYKMLYDYLNAKLIQHDSSLLQIIVRFFETYILELLPLRIVALINNGIEVAAAAPAPSESFVPSGSNLAYESPNLFQQYWIYPNSCIYTGPRLINPPLAKVSYAVDVTKEFNRSYERNLLQKLNRERKLVQQSIYNVTVRSERINIKVKKIRARYIRNDNLSYTENWLWISINSIIGFTMNLIDVVLLQLTTTLESLEHQVVKQIKRVKAFVDHKLFQLQQCIRTADDRNILKATEQHIAECISTVIKNLFQALAETRTNLRTIARSLRPLLYRFDQCMVTQTATDSHFSSVLECLKQIGYDWMQDLMPHLKKLMVQSATISKQLYYLSFTMGLCIAQELEASRLELSVLGIEIAKCLANINFYN